MRDDKYWPRQIDEIDGSGVSLLNEPIAPENVGVLVPLQQRSLHAVIAQSLKDTEALIERLELGVKAADSGRGFIRELYVQARKQREVLSAVLRLELE
jgi:hypothetical protein